MSHNHHIFEMPDAKGGFGIVAHSSKLMKKLDTNKSLFTGGFEACVEQKQKFIDNPKLLKAIQDQWEKDEKARVAALIKKHK